MKACFALYCKNKSCSLPIVLPLPIHLDKSPHQLLWPRDEKPRNFLCQNCKHVYEYTFQDVQDCSDEKPTQTSGWVDNSVYRIEARCGDKDCESPIHILVTAPKLRGDVNVKSLWFDQNIYGVAHCQKGHLICSVSPSEIEVHLDPDWTQIT